VAIKAEFFAIFQLFAHKDKSFNMFLLSDISGKCSRKSDCFLFKNEFLLNLTRAFPGLRSET